MGVGCVPLSTPCAGILSLPPWSTPTCWTHLSSPFVLSTSCPPSSSRGLLRCSHSSLHTQALARCPLQAWACVQGPWTLALGLSRLLTW